MGDTSEGGGSPACRFPLPEDGYSYLYEIEEILSRLTAPLTVPNKIAVWVAVIGLRRLPSSTEGLDVEISLTQPELMRRDGNWGWAEIRISEHLFALGEGGHVYSSAVGGDSRSRTVFESELGAPHCDGDETKMESWLERAKFLLDDADVSIEDRTDYESVQHAFRDLRDE